MRRAKLMACTMVAILLAGLPTAATADNRGWGCSTFAVTPAPVIQDAHLLMAIDTWGEDRAWVVGSRSPTGSLPVPLIERWDGQQWQIVGGQPESLVGGFSSVAAVGPDEIWTFGYEYVDEPPATAQLALVHVVGDQWSLVPGPPMPAGAVPRGDAMYAASRNDVWVSAAFEVGSQALPVFLHWDGHRWSEISVPLPAGATGATLSTMSGTGTNDIWAGGLATRVDAPSQPLLEHWNGHHWTIVLVADVPDTPLIAVQSVAAGQRRGAWLSALSVVDSQARFVVERGEAQVWALWPSPAYDGMQVLNATDLTADRFGHAWLISWVVDGTNWRIRADRWNGNVWGEIGTPPELYNQTGPRAVATTPLGTNTWIVADYPGSGPSLRYRSLVLRSYCSL